MKFHTGGIAHEPFKSSFLRLTRCNSEADGTVRMKEDINILALVHIPLVSVLYYVFYPWISPGAFLFLQIIF